MKKNKVQNFKKQWEIINFLLKKMKNKLKKKIKMKNLLEKLNKKMIFF